MSYFDLLWERGHSLPEEVYFLYAQRSRDSNELHQVETSFALFDLGNE